MAKDNKASKKSKEPRKSLERTLLESSLIKVGNIADLDVNREARTGIPEVVISEGKKKEHLLSIVKRVLESKDRVIVSRITLPSVKAIEKCGYDVDYNQDGMVCVVSKSRKAGMAGKGRKSGKGGKTSYSVKKTGGRIGIITAGTSDIPVAEEAKVIAEQLGCDVWTAYDVGVAGVHRVFPVLNDMIAKKVDVFIVAAGREGTLPALIAGLVDSPVIGLPVSTGYGLEGKGKTALYSMLQSCSPIVVVNIDAGFVAGAVAAQIANKIASARKT